MGFAMFLNSCEPGNGDNDIPEPPVAEEIINVPDIHFKAALVSTNSIDTNGDKVGDSDMDLNNDGEIQRSEAELIQGLIIIFNNPEIQKFVDLTGIENFINLEYIKMSGFGTYAVEETPPSKVINYDLTTLKKLEYLELNNLSTNYIEVLDLSGLASLKELVLINDKPYYEVFTDENIILPNNFIDVDLEGTVSLASLDITNSFLKIDLCQVPSLKRLNMYYLEGGEPEVFDFHCLTNLEWLNIGENGIKTLILKNSSVLNTLLAQDIGSADNGNYPFVENICIDDIPEEFEQIATLRNQSTVVVTDCTF